MTLISSIENNVVVNGLLTVLSQKRRCLTILREFKGG